MPSREVATAKILDARKNIAFAILMVRNVLTFVDAKTATTKMTKKMMGSMEEMERIGSILLREKRLRSVNLCLSRTKKITMEKFEG